jgi:signal transduction histidine kinase
MARFRTRARAVDMLGRQQIAGVPTAISELFKNAHDAYADYAIVDYYRSDRLFILRDDGIGMTEEDFEQRWLTLATESKVQIQGQGLVTGRPGYARRAVLGEKGIGRLAVAAIGPQVLILSRPLRNEKLGDLLVSLIHWGLFEIPGADLEQVEIPTLTVSGGRMPGSEEINTLIDWVAENLNELPTGADKRLANRIGVELEAFRGIDPDVLAAAALEGPTLLDGPGTHFYIRPADALITEDLTARDLGEPSDLLKSLVGFTNTMTPTHAKPALDVEFRDHFSEEAYDNVIEESSFFTPEEFSAADQHIQGRFDEKGQFSGTVRVYDADPVEIVIPYPAARGKDADCGPFQVDIAYQQGEQKRTMLDPEAWNAITSKLRLYGGLYIYRDGIRVLPYGNQDFDFLEMERNRSVSASDFFFSYRRIFGVVEITRANNSQLREKAGREGFAANEAYRQFRTLLKQLFYQVSFQFYRKDVGAQADRFWERAEELERLDKARRRRAGQVSERRRQLASGLTDFELGLDERRAAADADRIIAGVRDALQIAVSEADPSRAAASVARIEDRAREALRAADVAYRVERPRGMNLNKPLAERYARYEDARALLVGEVFEPARKQVDDLVGSAVKSHKLALARQLRIENAAAAAIRQARGDTRDARRALNTAANSAQKKAYKLGQDNSQIVEDAVARTEAELASLDTAALTDRKLVAVRARFETTLAELTESATIVLQSVTQQIDGLVWPDNGSGPTVTAQDQVEVLEMDFETLAEQASEQMEMTQLGMAVDVINHEFRHTVQTIRRSLRQLKVWADANPKLLGPYQELKTSFDHLDGYLMLFTPLQRRLYRTKVEIVGSEVETFLHDLFDKRLEESEIELRATRAFTEHRLEQYPSTIYPAFVNLVDNSLFWLTTYRGDRTITLDAGNDWMAVRDSGPGVAPDLGDDIFKPGVSTKPGGSGYGLFVSRQVLERDGMGLVALPTSADEGAEFRILEGDNR